MRTQLLLDLQETSLGNVVDQVDSMIEINDLILCTRTDITLCTFLACYNHGECAKDVMYSSEELSLWM
jgi:hypothetical protein